MPAVAPGMTVRAALSFSSSRRAPVGMSSTLDQFADLGQFLRQVVFQGFEQVAAQHAQAISDLGVNLAAADLVHGAGQEGDDGPDAVEGDVRRVGGQYRRRFAPRLAA